jgi:hypothetical protein
MNLVNRVKTRGRSGCRRGSRGRDGSGCRRRVVSGPSEVHGAGARAVAGEVTPLRGSSAGAAVPVKDFVELSCVVLVVRCVQFALDNRAILRLWALSASDRASCVETKIVSNSGVSQEDEEGTFK